jgi:rSAM/selenodomain-associated transferase 1
MAMRMARAEAGRGRVVVFAKAPVPGGVKTRLIPALGAERAAMLHMALTERAVATAQRFATSSGAGVELSCAPDASHAFFVDCHELFGIRLGEQGDGDLGARMLRALRRGTGDCGRCIVMGADAPAIEPRTLASAFKALDTADIVLAPADDGGYVLIGARRVDAAMFDGIDWGRSSVLAQQRAALRACELTWQELVPLWDVDRPDDLPRLAELKPPLVFSW